MTDGTSPRPGSRLWRALHDFVRRTTGRRLSLPVRFLDTTAVGGDFEASARAARRLLPGEAFDVIEHAPERTRVTLLALEHRSIGRDRMAPHCELLATVPVRRCAAAPRADEGGFVVQMAVTTEQARWAAVELYGFPCVLAQLRVTREEDERVCSLSVDGAEVLTLRAHEGLVSYAHERFRLFAVRDDDRVVGCTLALEGDASHGLVPGGARLELGAHPLADALRRLELSTQSATHLVLPHALGTRSEARVLGRPPREARGARPAPAAAPG